MTYYHWLHIPLKQIASVGIRTQILASSLDQLIWIHIGTECFNDKQGNIWTVKINATNTLNGALK